MNEVSYLHELARELPRRLRALHDRDLAYPAAEVVVTRLATEVAADGIDELLVSCRGTEVDGTSWESDARVRFDREWREARVPYVDWLARMLFTGAAFATTDLGDPVHSENVTAAIRDPQELWDQMVARVGARVVGPGLAEGHGVTIAITPEDWHEYVSTVGDAAETDLVSTVGSEQLGQGRYVVFFEGALHRSSRPEPPPA
jgi:hypothetical protein